MRYSTVEEGSTRLKVPVGGGVSKREEVFYNPHMSMARDVTVALCRLLRLKTFLDAMAGSGARGLRVAVEAGLEVTLNDLNPKAAELIRFNAALNGVSVDVEGVDAKWVAAGRRFDFVDLDPFGSPAEYVDPILSGIRWGGVLGVCATDTSALCGTYPKACMRKYDAVSLRSDCFGELGLRILLGFVARSALRHDAGVEPLFSHTTRHYMRVYVRLTGRVSDTLRKVGFLQYCRRCLWRGYRLLSSLGGRCGCGGVLETAGPMWVGAYADEKLSRDLAAELASGRYAEKASAVKLACLVADEQAVRIPHYDLHRLCRVAGCGAPSMASFGEAVRGSGHVFVRTHFNDVGFRSDMPVGSLVSVLEESR